MKATMLSNIRIKKERKDNGQKRLSNQETASFCSQTAMLFKAGITPMESMEILLNDSKTQEGKDIIQGILEVCRQGKPLPMRCVHPAFSPTMCCI